MTGNADAGGFLCFVIGHQEGGAAVVLGNQDGVGIVDQLFLCNEGHYVLCIPGQGARFHGSNLISRFCAVDSLSAVEDSGGAVIIQEGDGLSGGVKMGQGFAYFFAGMGKHDGRSHRNGQHRVHYAQGKTGFLNAEIMIFVQHRSEDGRGEQGGEGIGGVLGSHHLEEAEHYEGVNQKQLGGIIGALKVQLLIFPAAVQGAGDEEAPGCKAGEINDEVEIPLVVRRMFGHRGTEHIVYADEVQEEIISMEIAHGAVPGAGNDGKDGKTGKEMHMGHFLQVLLVKKEEQAGQARQEDTDGALGEGGQGSRYVAQEIVFPVFRIAQIEEGNGGAHEKEKGGVRNHRFGKDPVFQGSGKDDGGKPACLFSVGAAGKPVGKEHGGGAQNGSGQAGGHFIEAEEGKGKGQLPVIENGLIVPVAPVNLGRNPVAGKDHFLGG